MLTRTGIIGLLLAAVLALALRCPDLGERPMHGDEAVHAVKFGKLWEQGVYRYDPNEYHGPTLPYATALLGRLTGGPDYEHFTETRLRMVPLIAGLGLLLLLPLIADGLGRRAIVWVAFFTAVSPAMVFYSRYYIHEMLLVFFTFLALVAGWRYWRTRSVGWALLAGAALGLMQATKETFVITLAAAGMALAVNQVWNRLLDASGRPERAPRLDWRHLAAGLGAWILVMVVLFSSFFSNPDGVADAFRTYSPWLHRAGGESPHIHPWYFYFHRLLWFHTGRGPVFTEALLLALAVVGGGSGFVRKNLGRGNASFIRFLALYTGALTAAYALISYKTPWCLLSFWYGVILLAAEGTMVLIRSARQRAVRGGIMAVILAGTAHLAWQAWQAAGPYSSAPANPYVYAHTSEDILRLVDQVEALAQVSPQGRNLLIRVIVPDHDYWPLPWYWRNLKQKDWDNIVPTNIVAPVVVTSSALQTRFDDDPSYRMVSCSQLRPQVYLNLYVQSELWQQFLERNKQH
jgi:uncharacterized protein (TIGR03663 family)